MVVCLEIGEATQKTVRDGNGHVVYSLENVYEETNRKDHLNLKVNRYAHILDQGATLSDIEHLFWPLQTITTRLPLRDRCTITTIITLPAVNMP